MFHFILTITVALANLDRFWLCSHHWKQEWIFYQAYTKYFTSTLPFLHTTW